MRVDKPADGKLPTDAIRKHKKTYKDDDDDGADERSLGTAAALEALKKFNGGEMGDKKSKGAFLGLAMSEASKVRTTTHPSRPHDSPSQFPVRARGCAVKELLL